MKDLLQKILNSILSKDSDSERTFRHNLLIELEDFLKVNKLLKLSTVNDPYSGNSGENVVIKHVRLSEKGKKIEEHLGFLYYFFPNEGKNFYLSLNLNESAESLVEKTRQSFKKNNVEYTEMELHDKGKPRNNATTKFENRDVYHVVYKNDEIPNSEILKRDLERMTDLYNQLTQPIIAIHKEEKQEPTNLILYGPPGTGKTYNTINKSLEILEPHIDRDILTNQMRREEAIKLFNKHRENKQVMFCTFHQSFSYEEFVEGIRYDTESKSYEVKDGIFKILCDIARTTESQSKSTYQFDKDKIQFFKMSLGYIRNEEDDIFNYCIENSLIALGWGGEVDYSLCKSKDDIRRILHQKYPDARAFEEDAVERFKHWMSKGDIVVISHGNHKVRAIGKITGDYIYKEVPSIEYNHFRKVEWLFVTSDVLIPVNVIMKEKVFSQQAIYRIYKDDLNMENLQDLLSNGSNKSESSNGSNKNETQYVLVIDEINRGNISKIFGELITLIEADKRIGSQNETWVTLPYSGKQFAVPRNLHIIGTMNTADRSIALLDTALRRRFDFIEMMPEHSLLPQNVDAVNIQFILETINERIEYLYDRDHMIGHAYFLTNQPSVQYYIQVMKQRIIPLLQEYFYDNWDLIELVLGGSGKGNDSNYFLNRKDIVTETLFNQTKNNKLTDQTKKRYTINANPTANALRNICISSGADDEL